MPPDGRRVLNNQGTDDYVLTMITYLRQVSINISKPGITKGQHWHNSKWELFSVVSGHGLIQERNINTGETVEFEVSGDKIEAVYMIPGWTHKIVNLSETENLVTVMKCNEVFDRERPDTFGESVKKLIVVKLKFMW